MGTVHGRAASLNDHGSALYRVKRGVRQGGVRVALQRSGLLGFGRVVYNRLLLREGIARREVCEQQLRFAVHNKFEITEIDGLFDEAMFISRILHSLQQGDVVFDVGANIGVLSLAAAQNGGCRWVCGCVRLSLNQPTRVDFVGMSS